MKRFPKTNCKYSKSFVILWCPMALLPFALVLTLYY